MMNASVYERPITWMVEVDGNKDDYADCFFGVSARSYNEAWKKAIAITCRRIIRIFEK